MTTIKLQWLEHLWNHENMLKTGVVRANKCYSLQQVRRHKRNMFSIFSNMKVCCVFSFELPYRGDSNENTQYTIFNIKKENHPKLAQICSYGVFFQWSPEQIRNSRGKRAISVRATEDLLYADRSCLQKETTLATSVFFHG